MLSIIEDNIDYIANYGLLIQESNYNYEVKYYNKNEIATITGLSYVYLNECEDLLKENDNEQLIIVKYDTFNSTVLTPKVNYSIYNSEGVKLDLSVCDSISISYPIINKVGLNYTTARNLKDSLDVDIYNIKDDFFNDICYPM